MRKRSHAQGPEVSDKGLPNDVSNEYETPERLPHLTRATSGFVETAFISICFFCEVEGKDNRRTVMTEPLNDRVRCCAQILQDPHLLAKLAQGDLIAIEAQYHPQCLLGLYYKASKMEKSVPQEDTEVFNLEINAESLALADVIAYVEDISRAHSFPRQNLKIPRRKTVGPRHKNE